MPEGVPEAPLGLNGDFRAHLRANAGSYAVMFGAAALVAAYGQPRGRRVSAAVLGVGTYAALTGWAYWAHRLIHTNQWVGDLPFVRLHRVLHHDDRLGAALSVENLAFEWALNFFVLGGVLLLAVPSRLLRRTVDWGVVLLFATQYSFVHNVSYHLPRHRGFHRRHHEAPQTNYGPGACDHIFGTHVGAPEDMTHVVPVVVVSAVVLLLAKRARLAECLPHLLLPRWAVNLYSFQPFLFPEGVSCCSDGCGPKAHAIGTS